MNKLTSVEHDRTEKMEWLKKIIHSQLCYGLDTVKFAVRAESKQNWSTAKRTVYAANGEWNMNSSRICKQEQRIVPHEQMRTMSLKPLMRPTNQPFCILFHQINTIAIHIHAYYQFTADVFDCFYRFIELLSCTVNTLCSRIYDVDSIWENEIEIGLKDTYTFSLCHRQQFDCRRWVSIEWVHQIVFGVPSSGSNGDWFCIKCERKTELFCHSVHVGCLHRDRVSCDLPMARHTLQAPNSLRCPPPPCP